MTSFRRAGRIAAAAPRADRDPVVLPAERHFRGAGACLARSLARATYLQRRGVSSDIVVGVRAGDGALDAHAWLEPFDDAADYAELERHIRE